MDAKQFGPFSLSDVKHAFAAFDLDKNSFVGAAELRSVYAALGEEVTDDEIDEMIRMVDTDGDGQVSEGEFAKMIFRYAQQIPDKPTPGVGVGAAATVAGSGGGGAGAGGKKSARKHRSHGAASPTPSPRGAAKASTAAAAGELKSGRTGNPNAPAAGTAGTGTAGSAAAAATGDATAGSGGSGGGAATATGNGPNTAGSAAPSGASGASGASGGSPGLPSATPAAIAISGSGGGGGFGLTAAKLQEKGGDLRAVMNSLHINPEQIKKLMTDFATIGKIDAAVGTGTSGSGGGAVSQRHRYLLNHDRFCKLLGLDPSQASERMFALFDHDKSGQIDAKEFLIGLSAYADSTKDDKIRFAFSLYDSDGSGKISMSELIQIMKAIYMTGSAAQVQKKAEQIMVHGDHDKDGTLSFDEFAQCAKSFPNLLFPVMAVTKKVDGAIFGNS